MRLVFFILTVIFAPLSMAQSTIPENIHAVINSDGSLTYYLKTSENTMNQADLSRLYKKNVEKLFDANETTLNAFKVTDNEKRLAGFYITPKESKNLKPLTMAIDLGLTSQAVGYKRLLLPSKNMYTFVNQHGEIDGAWVSTSKEWASDIVGKLLPTEWSVSKISNNALFQADGFRSAFDQITNKLTKIPKEQVAAAIRKAMLDQARLFGCKSEVLPKDISGTIRIGVSLGFSAGVSVDGNGSMSFQTTWEADRLCNNKQ